jgi:hypothetical protein
MDVELVVLVVVIFSDGYTMLSYKDSAGISHTNSGSLTVGKIVEILGRTNRTENIPRLEGGAGRRTEWLDVALDHFLKEKFGFNDDLGEAVPELKQQTPLTIGLRIVEGVSRLLRFLRREQ